MTYGGRCTRILRRSNPEWQCSRPVAYPGAGGGLRYLVTGQIPLRLDVAYPLRATPFSEQAVRVHVNIFYML